MALTKFSGHCLRLRLIDRGSAQVCDSRSRVFIFSKNDVHRKFFTSIKVVRMTSAGKINSGIQFAAGAAQDSKGQIVQMQVRLFNTEKDAKPVPQPPMNDKDPVIKAEFKEDLEPDAKTKLKLLARDYGPTVIVVHILLSLCSLGMFYVLVEHGLPMESFLESMDFGGSLEIGTIAASGSFVIAYAIHKAFMPFRIAATGLITPLVVNLLRRKGILKPHIKKTT